MLPESLYDTGDLTSPLADCAVDADHILALLVDDRIEGDRRLTGPTVTDDQLSLTPADRDHRVDRLHPRLEGLGDWLPEDDTRGNDIDEPTCIGLDRALPIDRLTERSEEHTSELQSRGHLVC